MGNHQTNILAHLLGGVASRVEKQGENWGARWAAQMNKGRCMQGREAASGLQPKNRQWAAAKGCATPRKRASALKCLGGKGGEGSRKQHLHMCGSAKCRTGGDARVQVGKCASRVVGWEGQRMACVGEVCVRVCTAGCAHIKDGGSGLEEGAHPCWP